MARPTTRSTTTIVSIPSGMFALCKPLRSLGPWRLAAPSVRAHHTASAPSTRYLTATHVEPAAAQSGAPGVAGQVAEYDTAVLATYARPPLIFSHGSGMAVYTTSEGGAEQQYLDFGSGIAVNSLGHADPEVAQIAAAQSARLVHASNLFHNEWSGPLALKLSQLTGEHGGLGLQKGEDARNRLKAFFANSGTEANEAALKFVRKVAKTRFPGKDKTGLVCFHNAFHGRTMGALSVTPNPKYQAPFAPLVGNVKVGTYNDVSSLDVIDDSTAGVIVEPVQGEGGVTPATLEFLAALRQKCDDHGAVLVYDEIQCGLFRSGSLWAHSEMPLAAHPDIVTMAKPLANGFPIGATLMRSDVADAIVVGDHGTTFGGGPLVCRIAYHVLGRLADPGFVAQRQEIAPYLKDKITHLVKFFPDLCDQQHSPRGRGFLLGFSLKDPGHVGRLLKIARERGLIVLSAGKDTVRLAPSLIVTKEEIDKATEILESSLLVLREETTKASA